MALSADTKRTFEYVFVDDRGTEGERAITARFLSAQGQSELSRACKGHRERHDLSDSPEALAELLTLLRPVVVGCRGFQTDDGEPFVFDAEKIGHALTMLDLIELRENLANAMGQSLLEKKLSAMRLRSSTVASAERTASNA